MNRHYAFARNAEVIRREAKRERDSVFKELRNLAQVVEGLSVIAPASNNPEFTKAQAAHLAEEARRLCVHALRIGSPLNPIVPEF